MKIKKGLKGEGKRFMRKIGDAGYRQLVMDMIDKKFSGYRREAAAQYAVQTMRDVVSITVSAQSLW